jgi:2-polyprenyl-3-methyl-5-hydroxy-6-metoxy-1,4-benzoquinol methylase
LTSAMTLLLVGHNMGFLTQPQLRFALRRADTASVIHHDEPLNPALPPRAGRLTYAPFERVGSRRPVHKVPFVVALCAGRSVLDLGAYDETAVEFKQGTGDWLHGAIASIARRVVGIDNSPLLPADGLRTGERSVIVRGDITKLGSVAVDERPDVIVAGELIEHLPDALAFLRNLSRDSRFRGSRLVLTTPNACSLHNVILGLFGRESTHRDHLAIHSYKTLATLMRETRLTDYEIVPYHVRFSESALQARGVRRFMIRAFQRIVNALESAFPLLSGGWIVTVAL